MGKVIAGLYVAAVVALAGSAWAAWQLRCEGFGCMGMGVLWVTWSGLYLVVLLGGLALVGASSLGPTLTRVQRVALWVQAAFGAGLLIAWWVKTSH